MQGRRKSWHLFIINNIYIFLICTTMWWWNIATAWAPLEASQSLSAWEDGNLDRPQHPLNKIYPWAKFRDRSMPARIDDLGDALIAWENQHNPEKLIELAREWNLTALDQFLRLTLEALENNNPWEKLTRKIVSAIKTLLEGESPELKSNWEKSIKKIARRSKWSMGWVGR